MTREEATINALLAHEEAVKQESCGDCCNGNQIEKAKLCQKSYLAGMKHKQESKTDTFDKIIAEMEELIEWHDCPIELDGGNDAWFCNAVNRCVDIIDKYR